MDSKYKLYIKDGKPLEDINQFQRLVGKLIYLTVTRPDISYFISQIIKFMYSPRTSHLDVIDRVLRYLERPEKEFVLKIINLTKCVAISIQIGLEALIKGQLSVFAHLYAKIYSRGEARNIISWPARVPKRNIGIWHQPLVSCFGSNNYLKK
jgi:hypothetical protein